jgi:glycosyltransferase involved in cell wall biosynthesis
MHARPKVLHVVDSLAAGVATGVEGCIDRTADRFEHVVYGHRDAQFHVNDSMFDLARLVEMPAGKFAQARAVRRGLVVERPDVVHAHSTWAGWYTRLQAGRLPATVFTPHCYGFERNDLKVVRPLLRAVERRLSGRVDVIAACSEREAALSVDALGADNVALLPNTPSQHTFDEIASIHDDGPPDSDSDRVLTVATVGRITRQKDPRFMIDVVRAVERTRIDSSIRFVWIGGGNRRNEDALRAAGVCVTGWSSRRESLATLAAADVYLHTAAWEGMPLALIEALHLGLPVVARRIEALDELCLPTGGTTPDEIASALVALNDPFAREQLTSAWGRAVARRIDGDEYGDRLTAIYETAIESATARCGGPVPATR